MSVPSVITFDYAGLDPEHRAAVQDLASQIHGLVQDAAVHICQIGHALLAAKERLDHGQFGDWLAAEFAWSHATAARMMQVARRFDPQTLHGANFHASALYLLASGEMPEAARLEAVARAQDGEAITLDKARSIAAAHYASVGSLEQGLREWLAGLDLPGEDPEASAWELLAHLKEARKASAYWPDLVEALPAPHRQRDVVQAINNVCEQERVRRWQASAEGRAQKRQEALARARSLLIHHARLGPLPRLGRLRLQRLLAGEEGVRVWDLIKGQVTPLGLDREDIEALAQALLDELDQEQEDPAFQAHLACVRAWLAAVPIRQRLYALQNLTMERERSPYYARALAHAPQDATLDKALFFRVAAMVRDDPDLRDGLEPEPDVFGSSDLWGAPADAEAVAAPGLGVPGPVPATPGAITAGNGAAGGWQPAAITDRGMRAASAAGRRADHGPAVISFPADLPELRQALEELQLADLTLWRSPTGPYTHGLGLHLPSGRRVEILGVQGLAWRLAEEEGDGDHHPSA